MKIVNAVNNVPYGNKNYRNYFPNWLCGSCGCRFTETLPREFYTGIVISPGHQETEFSNAVEKIKHLNTKAGPITIALRKKQFTTVKGTGEECA